MVENGHYGEEKSMWKGELKNEREGKEKKYEGGEEQ